MAKYSIILPVRNGGAYAKKCVDSILTQTYADFDFIILDNCSTDGTFEWLSSVEDNRIRLIPSERPLTIEENWGRVKDVPRNEFMTLIGHDDVLYPDFLSTIDELTKGHPKASLYHTHYNFIDANDKIIRPAKAMKGLYSGPEFLQAFLTSSIDSMGTGYVMRSADYDVVGGMQSKYPNLLFADFELWTSLAALSYAVVAAKTCFSFRLHQSTTHTSQDVKLHNAFRVFTMHLAQLKKEDKGMEAVISRYGSEFLLHYSKAYAHRLLRTPLEKRNGLTVDSFLQQTRQMAEELGILSTYYPEKKSSLQLARRIDENVILRKLFLLFKKVYPKPVS